MTIRKAAAGIYAIRQLKIERFAQSYRSAELPETSRRIYYRLGCEGLVRVDYILSEKGLYFLEINPTEGR